MYALQLASGKPSALVDWNNNYGDDPDKCVFFHCGNWAKAFLRTSRLQPHQSWGRRWVRRIPTGHSRAAHHKVPSRSAEVSTDDREGCIRAYVGQGQFTDDPLETFGTRAVVHVPDLQKLMRFVCRNGFEHHAAMNASHCAGILAEAMDTYLGWEVHRHS